MSLLSKSLRSHGIDRLLDYDAGASRRQSLGLGCLFLDHTNTANNTHLTQFVPIPVGISISGVNANQLVAALPFVHRTFFIAFQCQLLHFMHRIFKWIWQASNTENEYHLNFSDIFRIRQTCTDPN